jgi:hypothetical protein
MFTRKLISRKLPDHYRTLPRLDEDLAKFWAVVSAMNIMWCACGSILMTHPNSNWQPIRDNLQGTKIAVQGLMKEMEPVAQTEKKGWMSNFVSQNWKFGRHSAAMATYQASISCHLPALEISLTMMKLLVHMLSQHSINSSR